MFAEVAARVDADCQPRSDIIFQEKCIRFSVAQEKRVRFLSNFYIGSSPTFRFSLARAERKRFLSNLYAGSSSKSDQKREKLLETNLFY